MTLRDLFPNIIILALDKRYDTHAKPLANHIIKRFGVTPYLFLAGDGERITTVPYDHIDIPSAAPRLPGSSHYPTWLRPSCYNAFLCQQKMGKLAKQWRIPNVLFLEDDMFFEDHTEYALDKLGKEIQELAWDLLYVGFCAPPHRTDINSEEGEPRILPAGTNCGGFHCVAIHSRMYDKIIDMPPLAPMDAMCDNLPNRYAIVPKLGEQKPGYSYVEQVVFTREDCARKLARVQARWPDA
jgi:hypothetical protein